jgi:hypothetical protein
VADAGTECTDLQVDSSTSADQCPTNFSCPTCVAVGPLDGRYDESQSGTIEAVSACGMCTERGAIRINGTSWEQVFEQDQNFCRQTGGTIRIRFKGTFSSDGGAVTLQPSCYFSTLVDGGYMSSGAIGITVATSDGGVLLVSTGAGGGTGSGGGGGVSSSTAPYGDGAYQKQ